MVKQAKQITVQDEKKTTKEYKVILEFNDMGKTFDELMEEILTAKTIQK